MCVLYFQRHYPTALQALTCGGVPFPHISPYSKPLNQREFPERQSIFLCFWFICILGCLFVSLTALSIGMCLFFSLIWKNSLHMRASPVTQMVKNLPAMWETGVQSLGWDDPLEKGMATNFSILAWRIPWTEEPAGYSSRGWKELDMTEQLHSLSQHCIWKLLILYHRPWK